MEFVGAATGTRHTMQKWRIYAVLAAIKIAPRNCPDSLLIPKPQGAYSGQYMGNLIFRDKITGKFHALNDWAYLKFEDMLLTHTGNGADLDKYSLLTMFSKLRKTARVKSDDKLMQTVLFHKIYEALSQARGLSR